MSTKREFLTWPNLFTLIRLFCIPLFIWVLFGQGDRLVAAWLLGALGSTDWFDGWLARHLDQSSRFGAVFDPTVDRLLFFVAVPSLIIDGSVPILVATLALIREVGVALNAIVSYLWRSKIISVTNAGKTGAFLLMFAFPMFLGSESEASYAGFLGGLAWVFAVPGLLAGFYSLFFEYLSDLVKPKGE